MGAVLTEACPNLTMIRHQLKVTPLLKSAGALEEHFVGAPKYDIGEPVGEIYQGCLPSLMGPNKSHIPVHQIASGFDVIIQQERDIEDCEKTD